MSFAVRMLRRQMRLTTPDPRLSSLESSMAAGFLITLTARTQRTFGGVVTRGPMWAQGPSSSPAQVSGIRIQIWQGMTSIISARLTLTCRTAKACRAIWERRAGSTKNTRQAKASRLWGLAHANEHFFVAPSSLRKHPGREQLGNSERLGSGSFVHTSRRHGSQRSCGA